MSDRFPTTDDLAARLDAAYEHARLPMPDGEPVREAVASHLYGLTLGVWVGLAAAAAGVLLLIAGAVWAISASAAPTAPDSRPLEPIEQPTPSADTRRPASLGTLAGGGPMPRLTATPPTPALHPSRAADRSDSHTESVNASD